MAKIVLDQVQLGQALWLCGPISVRRTAGTYGVASLVSRNPVILKLMPMHLYPTGETSDACSRSLLRTESYWIQWTSFSCDQAMCLCSPNHLAMVPCHARNTRPWKRCLEPSRGSTWHVHWLALAPCCLALRTSGLSAGPAGTGTWKDGKDGRFGRSSIVRGCERWTWYASEPSRMNLRDLSANIGQYCNPPWNLAPVSVHVAATQLRLVLFGTAIVVLEDMFDVQVTWLIVPRPTAAQRHHPASSSFLIHALEIFGWNLHG